MPVTHWPCHDLSNISDFSFHIQLVAMVTVPLACETSPSPPSEPRCSHTLGHPFSRGPNSLLTGLLPSAPLGYPFHSSRRFSLTCKLHCAALLVIILLMKLSSSAWPGMLYTEQLLQTLEVCLPFSLSPFHLMSSCFPNMPPQCLSTLVTGRPPSHLLPCSCTTCIIFCILFFNWPHF